MNSDPRTTSPFAIISCKTVCKDNGTLPFDLNLAVKTLSSSSKTPIVAPVDSYTGLEVVLSEDERDAVEPEVAEGW